MCLFETEVDEQHEMAVSVFKDDVERLSETSEW
jgi:hypothetical protein